MGASTSSSSLIEIEIPEKPMLLIEDFIGFYKQGTFLYAICSHIFLYSIV